MSLVGPERVFEAVQSAVVDTGASEVQRGAGGLFHDPGDSRPHDELIRPMAPMAVIGCTELVDRFRATVEEYGARDGGPTQGGKSDEAIPRFDHFPTQVEKESLRLWRQPVPSTCDRMEPVIGNHCFGPYLE